MSHRGSHPEWATITLLGDAAGELFESTDTVDSATKRAQRHHAAGERRARLNAGATLRLAAFVPLVASALLAGCGNSPAPTSRQPMGSSSPSPPAGGTGGATGIPSSTPFVRSDSEWTTYMGDPARTGVGPTTPAAANPRRTWTAQVDGDVYAEPLVAGGSVIVATEHDSVYSLDPASGAIRWRTHLGEPVPLTELACGSIDPNGITSTPVIDSGAGMIYVVAMLDAPMRHELFGLRLRDGHVAWREPADPPGASPRVHQQRGSLNLAHGRIYFSYGGFAGDCGRYNGWVVSAPATGGGKLAAWEVPSNIGGAVWAPPGPVISPAGDVWVTTGNTRVGVGGTIGGTYDGANAVMHLDPTLSRAIDSWAPQNWAALNSTDTDLGSLDPALLGGGLVFAAGKEGVGYLLRDSHLGGIGGEAFRAMACQEGGPALGAFGGAAVGSGMLLVPCKDGVAALKVDPSVPSFRVMWHAARGANSPVLAYGLVWTVAAASPNGSQDTWHGSLIGLDPATGTVKVQLPLGGIPHYPSPAAAGGNLYVAGLGSVYAVSVA